MVTFPIPFPHHAATPPRFCSPFSVNFLMHPSAQRVISSSPRRSQRPRASFLLRRSFPFCPFHGIGCVLLLFLLKIDGRTTCLQLSGDRTSLFAFCIWEKSDRRGVFRLWSLLPLRAVFLETACPQMSVMAAKVLIHSPLSSVFFSLTFAALWTLVFHPPPRLFENPFLVF